MNARRRLVVSRIWFNLHWTVDPRRSPGRRCSWSLDKLGPMTRSVEDTLLVLNAISGPDPGDLSSVPSRLDYDSTVGVKGLRVGYFPGWMKENPATDVNRMALDTVRKLGMTPVEVHIPDWPYDSLQIILFSEAAAAFEQETLAGLMDQLRMQVPDASMISGRKGIKEFWSNLIQSVNAKSAVLESVDVIQAGDDAVEIGRATCGPQKLD